MLRDRLVCGIRNKTVQRRLLQEVKLTYTKALDIAIAAETAEKDAKSLHTSEDSKVPPESENGGKPINRIYKNPKPRRQQQESSECYRCGGLNQASHCRFKEYECHFCKKRGHIASACRKKKEHKKEPREQANKVDEQTNEGATPQEDYPLFHIGSGSTKLVNVTVTMNGQEVQMELDTGASVSLMSEETFRKIKGDCSVLQESKARLFTYPGEPIAVVGSTNVTVDHNKQTAVLPLVITKEAGPTLLGRNWLSVLCLDWQSIFQVKSNLQGVLDQYSEVFREELGTVRGVKAKIYIEPDTVPKYHKARSVPFAWRERIWCDYRI